MAKAVQRALPDCEITMGENPDRDHRNYRVDFDRAMKAFPKVVPWRSLTDGAAHMAASMAGVGRVTVS